MIFNDVIVGTTSSDLVPINELELAARLGCGIDFESEIIKQNIQNFKDNVTYRYAYVRIPFKYEKGLCYFENQQVSSSALSTVLKDVKEVILLSVTAGIEIDKIILKTSIQNPSSTFYIDAIASAGIESYIEYISDIICEGLNVTKRFSPGYADFSLEFQSYLLNRLVTKENIGIMLSKDYLMIPTKSITAVIGIK